MRSGGGQCRKSPQRPLAWRIVPLAAASPRVRAWLTTLIFGCWLNRLASDTACRLGGTLGLLVWRLGFRRRVAQDQITRALGVRGTRRRRLLRRAYASIGASFLDVFTAGGPCGPERGMQVLNPGFQRRLRGRPLVFITPHLGSWDCAAHSWAALDGSLSVYAKALHNHALDAILNRQRARLGLRVVLVGHGDRREALRVMRQVADGGSIGVLPDQRPFAAGDARPADFLGHRCQVIAGASTIAARTQAVIVPVVAIRRRAGSVRVLYAPCMSGDEERLRRSTFAALSALVAAVPGQYMWTHRRLRDEHPSPVDDWRSGWAWFRRRDALGRGPDAQ